MRAVIASVVVVWAVVGQGSVAEAQRIGEMPAWTLSTDWGASMQPLSAEGTGVQFDGEAGITATVRLPLDNIHFFAEGTAFPLWKQVYTGRIGIIAGWMTYHAYSELVGTSTYSYGSARRIRVRQIRYYQEWDDYIKLVVGPVAAIRFDVRPDGNAAIGQLGFAVSGQRSLQALALYDFDSETPGMRIEVMHQGGRGGAFTYALRAGIEIFFDFQHHPLPALFTLGVGFGDGFDFVTDPRL